MRRGKGIVEARGTVDREREHTPAEAIAAIKRVARAKFDESIEVHIRTGLNVRHADEQLRGTIALPNGRGRDVSVAVFAQGDAAREAQEAGADVVGAEDLAKRVEEGFTDFDVAIATPDMMPLVGRLGRILGPAGKMPNPKVGTVTTDVRKAVAGVEGRQGRVPHRPHRDRAPRDRQEELRRPRPARELPGRDRGDHPRQAVGGEGALPAFDHARLDPGAGGQGRPDADPRHRRGGARGRSSAPAPTLRRPPAHT